MSGYGGPEGWMSSQVPRREMTEAEFAQQQEYIFALQCAADPASIAAKAAVCGKISSKEQWLAGEAVLPDPLLELGYRQSVVNSWRFFESKESKKKKIGIVRDQFGLFMRTAHDYICNRGISGVGQVALRSLGFNMGGLLMTGEPAALGMVAGTTAVGAAVGAAIGCGLEYSLGVYALPALCMSLVLLPIFRLALR